MVEEEDPGAGEERNRELRDSVELRALVLSRCGLEAQDEKRRRHRGPQTPRIACIAPHTVSHTLSCFCFCPVLCKLLKQRVVCVSLSLRCSCASLGAESDVSASWAPAVCC